MKIAKVIQILMIFVGISGVFSVLFGAWLSHGGQALPDNIQQRLSIALQYQFIHTLALFITVVWCFFKPSKWLVAAGMCFFCGVLCFSGTIYVKTLLNFALIGKITPFGGLLLALGWGLLSLAGYYLVHPRDLNSQTEKLNDKLRPNNEERFR